MSEEEIISEFGNLWEKDISNVVLLESKHLAGYTIIRKTTQGNLFVIIEDATAVVYIIQKLLENNVRIVNKISKV